MKTDVSPCSLDLPPHLGGLLKSYGMLLEYRVSCTGSRASVTLVYGDPVPPKKGRWRKRRRAPAAAQGETKPAAKPPAATPSAGPPNAAQLKRKTKMEMVSAPVINVPSAGTEESDMPDSVFCTSSYIRPDPPAFTSGLPDLSPIKPVASVETQARKTAVVKRKATTPPSATPAKPSRPTQPPNPVEQPEGPWTLKAGKLHPRFHQLIKINIEDVRQLISEPQHSAYLPLPTESDEGEFAVHRVQVDVDITAVCATVRRKGRYNQALLLKEMDNPSLHHVLKLLAGSEYSHIAKWIAASPYRRDLPLLDATDFIGSP
ncbi:uncharacterized protein LOC121381173 [Gigantopelta aegis]|uniref:uncharacterized protein LOC121381173 n=1 Tax=Gigantopelta aegis TaxID=1735272 RepID=UPI001B88C2E6|nr:uncharacterized protein LOC121381173 [Gigantopelta aegis]